MWGRKQVAIRRRRVVDYGRAILTISASPSNQVKRPAAVGHDHQRGRLDLTGHPVPRGSGGWPPGRDDPQGQVKGTFPVPRRDTEEVRSGMGARGTGVPSTVKGTEVFQNPSAKRMIKDRP